LITLTHFPLMVFRHKAGHCVQQQLQEGVGGGPLMAKGLMGRLPHSQHRVDLPDDIPHLI
jgi:hypothetical protein